MSNAKLPVEKQNDAQNEHVLEGFFDAAFLDRQTMGNAKLKIEILQLFTTQLKIHAQALQSDAAIDELKVRVHTLKGASLGVGAERLAQIAKRVEAPMIDGNAPDANDIENLRLCVTDTLNCVERFLAE